MTDELDILDEEPDGVPSATILVMHDDHLDSVSALMVTKKGFDE